MRARDPHVVHRGAKDEVNAIGERDLGKGDRCRKWINDAFTRDVQRASDSGRGE